MTRFDARLRDLENKATRLAVNDGEDPALAELRQLHPALEAALRQYLHALRPDQDKALQEYLANAQMRCLVYLDGARAALQAVFAAALEAARAERDGLVVAPIDPVALVDHWLAWEWRARYLKWLRGTASRAERARIIARYKVEHEARCGPLVPAGEEAALLDEDVRRVNHAALIGCDVFTSYFERIEWHDGPVSD